MEQAIYINKQFKIPKVGKIPLYVIIVVFVFVLAVLQDYIYSRVHRTEFYLSESLLYNTFWAVFIPFTLFINHKIKTVNPKNKLGRLPYNLGIGIIFSFLHISLFTSLFVFISNLVFSSPHHFLNIFNAAFSNQFYIVLLWYSIFPAIYISRRKQTNLTTSSPEKIKLKIASKIITVSTSSIQVISTDNPYSLIFTNAQKFLDSKSLKEFETELNPTLFLRVHRSIIVNSTFIKELKSRSNGDYDAKLENGQTIRLSRHYRNNWCQLLQ